MKNYNSKIRKNSNSKKYKGGTLFGNPYGNPVAKTLLIITVIFFGWELACTLLVQYTHKWLSENANWLLNILKLFSLSEPTPSNVPCLKTLIVIWIANGLIVTGLYGVISAGAFPKTLSLIAFIVGFFVRFILSKYLDWIISNSRKLTSCEEAESTEKEKSKQKSET